MKNYEKKYKEALERAKYLKENTDGVGALDVSACFEQIFPELCESEDERIRKTLIHIVKGACNKYGIKYQEKEIGEEKLLSWLENQGKSLRIKKGKTYLCTKTHKYAGVEWREGIKYYSSEDYSLVNQECTYYCPKYSKEEHNNFFKEVEYDGCLEKQGNYDYKRVNLNNFDDRIREFSNMLEDKPKPYWDGWYEAMDYVLKNGNPFEKQTKQNYIDADEDWYKFVRWFVKERTDNYTLIPSDDDIHDWGNIILNHARKLLEKQCEQNSDNKAESIVHSYTTPNPEFFQWIYDRLVHVHNENPNVDYMISLKERIEDMQKSSDKGEPKFKVGDLVVQGCNLLKIRCVGDKYYCYETVGGYVDDMLVSEIDSLYHLWTIQDAKDGDALVNGSNIFIFSNLSNTRAMGYCHINLDDGRFYDDKGKNECFGLIDSVFIPATKEQRDFLFQKMKESGYEFDADKKELKKIEQSFSLSKEDEIMFSGLISIVEDWYNTMSEEEKEYYCDCGYINWLNSLKNRVQPQQKQEWNEEDSKNLNSVMRIIENSENLNSVFETINSPEYIKKYFIDWLKSLKPNHWKPSKEQILTLSALCVLHKESKVLESLYSDLKKL